jgi:hypothetical protein
MSRAYNKKSDYWKKFDKKSQLDFSEQIQASSIDPVLAGEPFYTSDASVSLQVSKASREGLTRTEATGGRFNRAALAPTFDRYSSIRAGMLPYSYSNDGVYIREAIELCQKAYANVPIFRNAIDLMSEFSNGEIYLEGGTEKSRDFFYRWMRKIRMWDLKDQFFREYYRSGNIFVYRTDGKFDLEDFKKLSTAYAAEGDVTANTIPLKYIMLNPFDIVAKRATTFSAINYEKVLSEYDLERLRHPQTDEDRELLNSFPEEVRKQINTGAFAKNGLKIKIDPTKLHFAFYKKQDYEPFAIPFGYAVLADINAKLELKKMDQAITRTVENVILLITMGAPPDKGGINHNNLRAMQDLFRNESVGRVLISDYTTKADFVIPDLNKVLGPSKYETLNRDIEQGLQNIFFGDDKYGNIATKIDMFVDRLKESRQAFLSEFLQPEIKRIAKNLGFRSFPEARFKEIDFKDNTQLLRVTTRLMELGVITPQQGLTVFNTGRFPQAEEIAPAQETFVSDREKGYYNPIVGGVPVTAPPASEVNKTPKSAGRPQGAITEANFSRKNIQEVIYKIEDFDSTVKAKAKEVLGVKKLNKQQSSAVDELCKKVICAYEIDNWETKALECVKDFNQIESLGLLDEVSEIAESHQLDFYSAAILHHSKTHES